MWGKNSNGQLGLGKSNYLYLIIWLIVKQYIVTTLVFFILQDFPFLNCEFLMIWEFHNSISFFFQFFCLKKSSLCFILAVVWITMACHFEGVWSLFHYCSVPLLVMIVICLTLFVTFFLLLFLHFIVYANQALIVESKHVLAIPEFSIAYI